MTTNKRICKKCGEKRSLLDRVESDGLCARCRVEGTDWSKSYVERWIQAEKDAGSEEE